MALEIDTTAPDFELPNQFGEHVRLSDFRGRRPVALVFFPLAFTSTCTNELCELRDNLSLFASKEVELLAVSVDSKATLRAFAEREGYDFPLLADFWPHGGVAQAYGVFNEERGYANRGTFLIDKHGMVRFAEMNQPGERRDQAAWRQTVAEVLKVG